MSGFSHYEPCPRCTARGKDSRGDNFGVYKDGSKHCWACGLHEFPKSGSVHNTQRETNQPEHEKASLPFDFTREVPAAGYKWLLQYGMPYSYWRKQSIGYSPSSSRLVLCFGAEGGRVAFSSGRYIEETDTSASRTKPPRKWYAWGDQHKHAEIIGNPDDREGTVLVEDPISAHKVGNLCPSIPLFGVEFHPAHIWATKLRKGPVYLWLDYDQRDVVQSKALRLQSLIDRPVMTIVTEKDPKNLSFDSINSALIV